VFAGGEIYDYKNEKYLTLEQFAAEIPQSANVVMGEYHYIPLIQKGEGDIIRAVVDHWNLSGNFTLAWEFQDYVNHDSITDAFNKYSADEISGVDLIKRLFGAAPGWESNMPYLEMFKATKDLSGVFIGVNAQRSVKQQIIKNGLESVDKGLIPPDMELGGTNYYERFKETMGGHGSPDLLYPYFVAQSYTDSVMAYQMERLGSYDLRFLVVGSFHSDYNDGTVAQLRRYSSRETITIKLVEVKDYTEEELKEILTPHPTYGPLADYIYLIND